MSTPYRFPLSHDACTFSEPVYVHLSDTAAERLRADTSLRRVRGPVEPGETDYVHLVDDRNRIEVDAVALLPGGWVRAVRREYVLHEGVLVRAELLLAPGEVIAVLTIPVVTEDGMRYHRMEDERRAQIAALDAEWS